MLKKLFFIFIFLSNFLGFSQKERLSYFEKGVQFTYTNQDSAYIYLNKALDLAKSENSIDQTLATYLYLINANGFYFDLVNFKRNLNGMANIIRCDSLFKNYEFKEYYQNYYLFNKAHYYFKLGKYEFSEDSFLGLYHKLQALPEEHKTMGKLQFLNSILSFLAKIYYDTGKTSLANLYYHKKMALNQKFPTVFGNEEIAYTNLSLAALFQREKQYDKAEKQIQKALSIYSIHKKDPQYRNNLVSSHQLLANNYLLQKQPKKALIVLKKMERSNLIDVESPSFLKDLFKYKGSAFAQKEDFETSLQFYQKALNTTQKYYKTKHHVDIAELYAEMGEVYAKQQQFEKSLSSFQKALAALSKEFESANFADNPRPGKVLSKLELIEVLRKKQESLAKAYTFENKLDYLKAANQTAKDIVSTLDALKPEFESKVDMQFLLEETYPAFYQMMETAFLLHQKTGEQTYLEDAFYFSEKSKAVLLLSAVQKTGATKFAGIPDSVLTQEQQYRATINHLEKKRFRNPNEEQLSDQLFDLKNEFYAFLNFLAEKYPKYHRLKYKTQVATLPEIQNLLQPEEAMLDYYLTDDFLYYFVIEKENIRLERIPFSETASQRILQLQKHFSDPQVTKTEELKTLSNQVYEALIPEIGTSVSSVIILRSGILNYLPFGALYNKKENNYLIEDYAVSYAISATLYKEYATQKEPLNPQILAFAPSFSGEKIPEEMRAGLGQLLYNKKEVKLISNYFNGKILLNEEASLKAFENNAEKYGILHLATHAIINDKFPDYSYLAFTTKDSLASLLYIHDLYNYDLKADLVVLSACETGIGKLQKGAGMLSLARGFNYAGASSLVTTQWKIDDKSSSFLMKNFYKNLAKGESKNAALRHAKLHYLKSTDDAMQRHHYYWAGFVLTGNTSPIVETSTWYWWFAGGLGLIGLIFLGFRRRRNLKS